MAEMVLSAMVQAILQSPIRKAISAASHNLTYFWGFKEDLETLKISFTMAQAFLSDVHQRSLFRTSIAFKTWLENIEALAYEADNVLDEFNYELLRCKLQIGDQMKRKVMSFFSFSNPVAFRVKMAYKIKEVNMRLKAINEEANAYGLNFQSIGENLDVFVHSSGMAICRETDSISVHPKVVGRENDIAKTVEMLLNPSDEVMSVIAIVGMGGLGKTTLARVVYQDKNISNHFQEKIWVSATESFEAKKILRLILESLAQQNYELQSREAVVKRLQDLLAGKRYLLVLDDMWNECSQTWTDFVSTLMGIGAAKGNCILVTTRNQQVASTVAGHSQICLKNLSTDDIWSILKEKSFTGKEVLAAPELEDIGKKIADKCLGLPLVASVVGGMFRTKDRDEWLSVLEKGILDSSGDDNNVLGILKLSFDRLPTPALKKCFAYCSIFPKGFEIESQQLIQLWMAEGFLQPNPRSNMAMEEIGDMFFNILLQNNLLQDVEKDVYNNILCCKMHDLVHDLACSISGSKIVNVEDDQSDDDVAQARCLALHTFQQVPDEFWKDKARYLRTLFLKSNMPHEILLSVRNLYVLNLSGAKMQELPISIGKLIHLRYLGLSKTELKSLPNSLSMLHHLQTLQARKCPYLCELPDRMKTMINLRHLYYKNDNEDFQMPLDMGHLTCLQTLQFFSIGKEKGRKIEELGFLQNLRGKLDIRNLENVCNKDEAQCADLYGKPYIYKLSFHWSNSRDRECCDNNDENVLEGLEPHPNLKSLKVQNFMSTKFPLWIMKMAVDIGSRGGLSKKLDNLVKIRFSGCERLEEVPALGLLPSLQYLKLEGLYSVTRIGEFFYGIDDSGESSSCNSGDQAARVLFPKLRSLSMENMPNLLEWMDVKVTPETGSVVVFPFLEELTIENCCHLMAAPRHFPSLKRLSISSIDHGSSVITNICSEVTTLTSLSIICVRELAFLPDWLPQNNSNLRDLELICCPDLINIVPKTWGLGSCLQSLRIHDCKLLSELPADLHALQSLISINIYGCHNLRSFPLPSSTQCLISLRILQIVNCDGLVHLPNEMLVSVRTLESLTVYNCRKLTSIPKGLGCLPSLRLLSIGPFGERMEFNALVDFFDGLQELQSSLHEINLYGLPQWHSLPDQLQHLSTLRKLYLSDFGLELLPDWLGNLSSLEHLCLCNCVKLQYLPSMQAMKQLSKLRRLDIYDCPLLKGRYIQSSSSLESEWSKTRHIPEVWIDEVRMK